MRVVILLTSKRHPVYSYLLNWVNNNEHNNQISIVHSAKDLVKGDILFLISYNAILSKQYRNMFKKTLAIHASDLPHGRGWSPHIWQLINGRTDITLSLFEVEDKVDSGDIWKKINVRIPKTALFDKINQLIFNAELYLMSFAIENFTIINPKPQSKKNISYFPKRIPEDSEIDINRSLDDQFNLIRVCDENRFPAFFYKDGQRFNLIIKAVHEPINHKILLKDFGDIELYSYVNLNDKEKKLVLRMRNHPEIKKWMYNQNTISEIEHSDFIKNLKYDVTKRYFLVKQQENILGSINFSNININYSVELGLYSNPFSQLKGVGRILNAASSFYAFNELGVKNLKLEVFSHNERAISFYNKCGFEVIKTVETGRYNTIYMEKKISNEQLDKY
jgi:methionyl-tRNA formyltransferase